MQRFVFLLLLLLGLPVHAAKVRLEAPEPVAGLIARYINLEDSAVPASPAGMLRRMQLEIPALLATEGYFSATVALNGATTPVTVVVTPGPRATITALSLKIEGMISQERRQAIERKWLLKVGAPFRQADWDAAKQEVLRELLAEDHAGANLTFSQAEVDAAGHSVRLRVEYQAGPRYRYGELRMDGLLRYRPELVERFNRSVRPGAIYRESDLLTLQTNLQNTPYFSSVLIDIDTSAPVAADGTVTAPVYIRLRERSPHRVSFGAGVSSNTGARVEANYRTADLFHRAWELSTGLRIEQLKQTAYADVFLPPTPDNYRDSFGALAEKSNIRGLTINRAAIGAARAQQRGQVDYRLGVNWQTEQKLPLDALRSDNKALTLNLGLTWRASGSRLDTGEGQSAQLQIGGGAKAVLSDQNFVRLHGRYQTLFNINRSNSMMLRAELGATLANSRQGIPQDFLFRAGGTNSVRGYAYQSLGVREGSATVGGRYLAVLSAEITHWLSGPWGIAAFVDAGDAADTRADFRFATGVGMGARWRSPAGPVAIDIGHGTRTGETHLHFSLAVPF